MWGQNSILSPVTVSEAEFALFAAALRYDGKQVEYLSRF